MNKEFEEAMDSLNQYQEEVKAHNEGILKEIGHPDLRGLMEDCYPDPNVKMEIVDEPQGVDQFERRGFFSNIYIDQWTTNEAGDSFAGFVYGKLPNEKWLAVPFIC